MSGLSQFSFSDDLEGDENHGVNRNLLEELPDFGHNEHVKKKSKTDSS